MLVLPEEREQPPAKLAQVRGGGRAALDVGAGPPFGTHPASEHHLAVTLREPLPQIRELGRFQQPLRKVEDALDVCLGSAGTDNAGARLAAQQQVERVGEDGLPGARLAGDRIQARPRPHFGTVDQQQVLYPKLKEHLSGVPAGSDGAGGADSLAACRCVLVRELH